MSKQRVMADAEPRLGWVALSRKALASAEKMTKDGEAGVRDEVGVLAIHRGYANRFFPGTSVQHSRIRYLLFVAWQLQDILQRTELRTGDEARKALKEAELQLALQLFDADLEGVIGGQTAKTERRLTVLPASAAYWSALVEWGVLQGGVENAPSRRDVFAAWNAWAERPLDGRTVTDDESGLLQRRPHLLDALPERPTGWPSPKKRPLDFTLSKQERVDLRRRLVSTRRDDGRPTLLSALAADGFVPSEGSHCWHRDVVKLADTDDKAALRRAREASALAGILRGLYNACIEALRERQKVASEDKHRAHLAVLVKRHGAQARRVKPLALAADGITLGGLAPVLQHTLDWLASTPDSPLAAREWLGAWEAKRKGDRARLPATKPATDLRVNWSAPPAQPLDYRWGVVASMLEDLGGHHGG